MFVFIGFEIVIEIGIEPTDREHDDGCRISIWIIPTDKEVNKVKRCSMSIFTDKKRCRRLLMILAVLVLTATGCGDSNTPGGGDGDDAPTVPPAYTLVPDFGDLGGEESGGAYTAETLPDPAIQKQPAAGSDVAPRADCLMDNFAHASFQVGLWNLALTATLAVPVGSFAEAFQHEPVRQDDGSWVWSYSATVLGVLYTAELHGAFVDEEVHWDMFITKQGFFEDFLWYSGVSNLPATAGTWTIRKSPEEDYDWIGIDWSREASNETWQVQYMNVHEADDDFGGYIHYGVTSGEPYNAFYDIYYGAQGNLVQIDANRTSHAGRVSNPAHFNDEDWHYWDANHCNSE